MIWFYLLVVIPAISGLYVAPSIVTYFGQALGWCLRRKSRDRRAQLLSRVQAEEEDLRKGKREVAGVEEDGWETVESHVPGSAANGGKAPKEWEGVVGFFHPFCNAGGGGERVLWAAIRTTQKRWPKAICVVYTGDHDVDKVAILERVEQRFNIQLHPPTVMFLYLSTRHYILSSTYPHITLLGQSLGSLIVAYDAFSLLVPDIFIDTMGYAFVLAFSKFLFPSTPTGAYVHYPTISTDMLGSLSDGGQGLNAGTGKGWKGKAKRRYWHLFAQIYSWVGGCADIVMTNSSWTQAHIRSLWGPTRAKHPKFSDVQVVFPPVAVEELEREIDASAETERRRERIILYIAQFRPEKNHTLILKSFAELLSQQSPQDPPVRLALIGSVRNSDDATRVYDLRLLAHELRVKDSVSFICDASWPEILNWLRKSWVGVNGMWNEHFGIGIVEYQAAGLISVVHDSGGPKEDIVIEFDGGPTGFHATTASEFAAAFKKVFALSTSETLTMRRRARASAKRFTEEAFATRWISQMERLLYKDFAAEYKEKFGRPPVLNPEGQFKMDFLPTTKKELQDRGLQEQSIYKAWFDKHIITTDEEGCSNALFLTPWSSGEPDYRDTYRERPNWIGDEFRYWFVCPYAEAPEMIIPIGQTPYMSRVTHRQEWLPVAIGVMSAKGSGIDLVELIKDMMIGTGMETQVEVGRTPLRVRGDHESALKQEDGQRPLHLYDSSG